MPPLLFVAFLLITFATSALLVASFFPGKRSVAWIGLLTLWLCAMILPVQWLALLDLFGMPVFLRSGHLLFWSGLAFLCALLSWLRRRNLRIDQSEEHSEPPMRLPWHIRIGQLVVLGVYGILSLRMAFSFPDGWDTLAYHYPVALRWLQSGTMRMTSTTDWRLCMGNVELLDVLGLSAGLQRSLGMLQWPGLFILLLACLYLGRRLSESEKPAWAVATTVLMVPMVAFQSISGYVDLFGTAALFASLALVLEYSNQRKHNVLLIVAGLACGLSVGTKPVFWVYAAALFVGVFFALSWQDGRLSRNGWGSLSLFLAGCALSSGFWFIRSTMGTGNPLYPFAVHLGPISLPGYTEITDGGYYMTSVRHWAEWFVHPWIEWKASPGFLLTNYTTDNGLGGAFATFAMPGVLFAAWLAARQRPFLRPWLAGLGLVAISWWFLLLKVGRFGLPLFVLAIIIGAPLFEVLEKGASRIYRSVYVLVFAVTACILIFEPLYTIAQTLRYRMWSRASYLGYAPEIDTLKPGSTVLNLGHETLNFMLAGSRLTNKVISSWEAPAVLTPDFLRSQSVDYVIERSEDEPGSALANKIPPAEGLEIYFSGTVKHGGDIREWRIWRTTPLRDHR